MAFGKPGSVRDFWHYTFKALRHFPNMEFEEFWKMPQTKKNVQLMIHQLGEEKAKERARTLFYGIKDPHGYSAGLYEEDECKNEDEEAEVESLEEQVNRAVYNFNSVNRLVENICRKNVSLSRYHSMNPADKLSYVFNESCPCEDEEEDFEEVDMEY